MPCPPCGAKKPTRRAVRDGDRGAGERDRGHHGAADRLGAGAGQPCWRSAGRPPGSLPGRRMARRASDRSTAPSARRTGSLHRRQTECSPSWSRSISCAFEVTGSTYRLQRGVYRLSSPAGGGVCVRTRCQRAWQRPSSVACCARPSPAVAATGGFIYWSHSTPASPAGIGRANLDNLGANESFITGTSHARGRGGRQPARLLGQLPVDRGTRTSTARGSTRTSSPKHGQQPGQWAVAVKGQPPYWTAAGAGGDGRMGRARSGRQRSRQQLHRASGLFAAGPGCR